MFGWDGQWNGQVPRCLILVLGWRTESKWKRIHPQNFSNGKFIHKFYFAKSSFTKINLIVFQLDFYHFQGWLGKWSWVSFKIPWWKVSLNSNTTHCQKWTRLSFSVLLVIQIRIFSKSFASPSLNQMFGRMLLSILTQANTSDFRFCQTQVEMIFGRFC